ncbi:unnamed protein product [Oncorhynchus mykiss]|uniref:Uncharacterized protein n=1 Tax=Oncorhynchus mykiss TaxID=8022 RepID=A0A060XAU4_ONCMY|nr:unnamed protein product [Oncorhynchus mykiss]
MVGIRRLPGPKNSAEMTYYAQLNGAPITGTTAAKTLSTLDSQTMALTLGYFVLLQADPVVKVPPANLWIMAVLTPVALVMVVVAMVTAILCKRNRVIFKTGAFRSFKPRSKTSYRREGSYHHQHVQGFDYAKKHIGHQQGEETVSVTKETLVLGLPVRDAPLSLDRKVHQDGTASKRPPSADIIHKGMISLFSLDYQDTFGFVCGNTLSQGKCTKNMTVLDRLHRICLNLLMLTGLQFAWVLPIPRIAIERRICNEKLVIHECVIAVPQNEYSLLSSLYPILISFPTNWSFDQSHQILSHQIFVIADLIGQKNSYCLSSHLSFEFPMHKNAHSNTLEEMVQTNQRLDFFFTDPTQNIRHCQLSNRSPLSLADLDPLGLFSAIFTAAMLEVHCSADLGSNSTVSLSNALSQLLFQSPFGWTPGLIQTGISKATNTGPLLLSLGFCSVMIIQQNAFERILSIITGEKNKQGVNTQWCIGFRFTQLPDMGVGPPPPLIPSRPGPPTGTSMRLSSPDVSLKPRVSEASEMQSQHNGAPYLPLNRAPFPAVTVDQSMTSYSGNPMTGVYAISANRPGYSDYFVMPPPASYGSPSWMSYPPEPEDIPHQWNETVNTNPCHLETIC